MTRTLLTGGSGFIAAHVLDHLLESGHSVVTTVRSTAKADKIREAHPNVPKSQLDFAIVEDIAVPGAFDEAVKSDPPFEAVIHTASPFHFNVTDVEKDLLNPAIIGTTGILNAVKKNAPSVKRVVITSSFASIVNPTKGLWPEHTYSSKDWSPLKKEDATKDASTGYRASKTLAERAAWDFVKDENPNFTLATVCPPLVFGPIVHYLNDLKSLNTSNERVRNFMAGDAKEEIPDTGIYLWVDVRDLAQAHVKSMEQPDAANKRFFVAAGYFCNKDLIEILRKNVPDVASKLPAPSVPGGTMPDDLYKIDASETTAILGTKYRTLEASITDLARSLQAVGA